MVDWNSGRSKVGPQMEARCPWCQLLVVRKSAFEYYCCPRCNTKFILDVRGYRAENVELKEKHAKILDEYSRRKLTG
jgi:endogenous inhibitor of DNA gyrase (YacG/DUF329 family)